MNKEQLFNLNRHFKGATAELEKAIEKWKEDMIWLMEGKEFTDEQKLLIKKRLLTNRK